MSLKGLLNLEGITILSKEKQKDVVGGTGTCAYYNSKLKTVFHDISKTEAVNSLQAPGDHWCCSSCQSASWWSEQGIF